jgi:hypothetical protein
MYLAGVPFLARALQGVCIPLSWPQSSGVEPSWFDRRGGVRNAILVDPSDLRPPLDGEVGRLEAKALDQDRPRWMLVCPGRGLLVRPRADGNLRV